MEKNVYQTILDALFIDYSDNELLLELEWNPDMKNAIAIFMNLPGECINYGSLCLIVFGILNLFILFLMQMIHYLGEMKNRLEKYMRNCLNIMK